MIKYTDGNKVHSYSTGEIKKLWRIAMQVQSCPISTKTEYVNISHISPMTTTYDKSRNYDTLSHQCKTRFKRKYSRVPRVTNMHIRIVAHTSMMVSVHRYNCTPSNVHFLNLVL